MSDKKKNIQLVFQNMGTEEVLNYYDVNRIQIHGDHGQRQIRLYTDISVIEHYENCNYMLVTVVKATV